MTYFYLILTTFFWASVFHLAKYAIAFISPPSAAAWRFIVAGVVLSACVYFQKAWDAAALRRNLWTMVALGLIGVFGFNTAMFFGLQHTTSVNAALIMAFCPAMTAVLSAALMSDKIAPRQWLGFAVSFAGVMTIVSQGSLHKLLAMSFSSGDLLMLLACFCWAMFGVIAKRNLKQISNTLMTTGTIVVGAIALAIAAQFTSNDFWSLPPLPVAGAVVAMAVFGSVLAYLWWAQGIARLGAPRTAIFINLVPVFAALIGVGLGQALSGAQIGGALLVMIGVMFTTTQQVSALKPGLVTRSLCKES